MLCAKFDGNLSTTVKSYHQKTFGSLFVDMVYETSLWNNCCATMLLVSFRFFCLYIRMA